MNSTFFPSTLPPHTAQLVSLFKQKNPDFLKLFYLSGGTALSLQLGHRESEDLDFFSQQPFNPQILETELTSLGSLSETELSKGTLNTFFDRVKLQFLEYPYPILEPFVLWEGVSLSSVSDIACTKLQTIGMRGSKKDFIDLYFLLEHYSLTKLLRLTKKKYVASDYSQTHILKSLVYFEDAESQPMPRMHKNVSWDEVKGKLILAVKSIDLMGTED